MNRSLIIRLILLIIAFVVLFGAIFFIYRFFSNQNPTNTKFLSITKDGKFNPTSTKIDNNTKFRFKNERNVNQTVKVSGTNATVAEVEPNSFSKEISLKNDSRNVFYLASDNNQKATVEVGKPIANSNPTPQAVDQPAGAVQAVNTNGQPLPNTGPGELVIYPILALIGFLILKFSNKFWKMVIH